MRIVKHIEYDEEYDIPEDDKGMPLEPKCPGCGYGALRQKCAFEYGDCPRHDIAEVYREVKLKWANEHPVEGCTCHDHWKKTDKWPNQHSPVLTLGPACVLYVKE